MSIENEEEQKPALYFRNARKGMIVNRTNGGTVAGVYGDETDNWIGKPVVIFTTTTAFGGRMVPCLRLRVPAAAPPPAPALPATQTDSQGGEVGAGDNIPF